MGKKTDFGKFSGSMHFPLKKKRGKSAKESAKKAYDDLAKAKKEIMKI